MVRIRGFRRLLTPFLPVTNDRNTTTEPLLLVMTGAPLPPFDTPVALRATS
jgi:hypothetical protein